MEWAKSKALWNAVFRKNIIFIDVKKFDLNGPYGLQYYWHDLGTALKMFSDRAQGGKSDMVSGPISYDRTIDVVGISERTDAEYYNRVLEQVLLPTANRLIGDEWALQKKCVSAYSSKMKKFWEAYDIDVPDWPANSLNLIIIKNFWVLLARNVYEERRQLNDLQSLQDSIMKL